MEELPVEVVRAFKLTAGRVSFKDGTEEPFIDLHLQTTGATTTWPQLRLWPAMASSLLDLLQQAVAAQRGQAPPTTPRSQTH